MSKTLEELRNKIEEQVPYVDVKPFSHNIIGLLLSQAGAEFGIETANQIIEDFNLESLGWHKVEQEK